MYEHLKDIPPIMDHNRACLVADSIAYMKTRSENLTFITTLPTEVLEDIYKSHPGMLTVIVLHKGKYRAGVIRDRPINAYNVMLDDMPYVYFANELFEPGSALSFQQVAMSEKLAALFVKMRLEGMGTTWGQEEMIINALGAKRMPYVFPVKEVKLPSMEYTPLILIESIPIPPGTVYEMAKTIYWPKGYWTWLNIAKHQDRDWRHHDGCCDSVLQAVKGEEWFVPPIKPVREDITQSEEYKAMLAARGKK